MKDQSLVIANIDLQVLEKLLSFSGLHSLSCISEDLGVDEKSLLQYIQFLESFGFQVKIQDSNGKYLDFEQSLSKELTAGVSITFSEKEEEKKFDFSMSLKEWFSLELLKNKVLEQTSKDYVGNLFYQWLEKKYKDHNLPQIKLSDIDQIQCQVSQNTQDDIINIIEASLENKKLVCLKKSDLDNELCVLPRRLVYIDGKVNLVFEYQKEHFLDHASLESIRHINLSERVSEKFFTQFEIEDYISSLRFISDNCVRLILKVNNEKIINDFPKFHYLGNPCKIMNPLGDIIWAAHVEINQQIFDWLYQCRGYFDIIDPVNFKEEFINFCKTRDKSAA